MPFATIDGITTRYEVVGDGPPLLMFSPGGFDATLDKWRSQSIYTRVRPLDNLGRHYRCIAFDRRETGQSGGRVERITWQHYVAQGRGLLDHLGIAEAHLMGGCMGCAPVTAFAVEHPERVLSMILWWPVGGARYRIRGEQRFAEHLAFVAEHGLAAAARLAVESGKSFAADPRVGPWATVVRNDVAFAAAYADLDVEAYKLMVTGMAKGLFDRDTAPGAEPEDLLRLAIPTLVVPGRDDAHATSAARYLEECIPGAHYWDAPVAAQTEEHASRQLLDFLASAHA
ncbi:MAG: alpha/beta hydrolase [Casimicrobiaceae bacterium]